MATGCGRYTATEHQAMVGVINVRFLLHEYTFSTEVGTIPYPISFTTTEVLYTTY